MLGKNIFLLILLCSILQACANRGNYSVDAYRSIGNQLKRNYDLDNANLIVAYDLARINKTNGIFASDLGSTINDKRLISKYLSHFKKHYKSLDILQKEAKNKIIRITELLEKIQHKYSVLSVAKHQYLIRLELSDLTGQAYIDELENLDKITAFVPMKMPIENMAVTSKYGNRPHPIKKRTTLHCGLDMVAKSGAKIYASANGKIIFAGKKPGYGNVVIIEHTKNLKTLYAHLNKVFVKKGFLVPRGKAIGTQGNTGSSTKDHLHFEIHVNDKHINPYDFIAYDCIGG